MLLFVSFWTNWDGWANNFWWAGFLLQQTHPGPIFNNIKVQICQQIMLACNMTVYCLQSLFWDYLFFRDSCINIDQYYLSQKTRPVITCINKWARGNFFLLKRVLEFSFTSNNNSRNEQVSWNEAKRYILISILSSINYFPHLFWLI